MDKAVKAEAKVIKDRHRANKVVHLLVDKVAPVVVDHHLLNRVQLLLAA